MIYVVDAVYRLEASTPSFEEFYEDAVAGRARVLNGSWGVRCVGSGAATTLLERCPEALDKVVVPRYATNDYLVRIAAMVGVDRRVLSPRFDEQCGPAHSFLVASKASRAETSEWEADILPGQGLFAPGETTLRGEFMRYCFVDASNLAALREALLKGASFVIPAKKVLKALDEPHFDVAMDREPIDLSWEKFVEFPRDPPLGRKKSFADWQLDVAWQWRIIAATVPRLEPPDLVRATCDKLWVRVDYAYQPKSNDDALFGLDLEYDSVFGGDDGDGNDAEFWGNGNSSGSVFIGSGDKFFEVGPVLPGRLYRARARLIYGDAAGTWSDWSASRLPTPKRSRPAAAARPKVDTTTSSPGRVRLVLSGPHDDGGDPIVGWLVQMRRGGTSAWKHLGSFKNAIDVDGLMPSECPDRLYTYEFVVAAYNRLGVADWSLPSLPSTAGCVSKEKKKHTVRGRARRATEHHFLFLFEEEEKKKNNQEEDSRVWEPAVAQVREKLAASFDRAANDTLGPVAVVAETRLEIWDHAYYGRPGTVPRVACDLWTSHWSPTHVDIAADLVPADPPDASETLRNADAVSQRVVLVRRGNAPLAFKARRAQAAGALAMVVADDGQCEDKLDQYCVPGADRSRGEKFAATDNPKAWDGLRIPVALILHRDALRVLEVLSSSSSFWQQEDGEEETVLARASAQFFFQ
ncbi:hypothetical protein CTAYLR_009057 [Chrysophaeum taylorii]|uniref:PA domain-containing protein n=1 Tax=Chrysophaeum taylorii TaxID=2483200 RepID=A0AAD7UBJ6_9STRA|nr:hypothetical protein CTAYLR_009057 [Chrysophaeum taylorii]